MLKSRPELISKYANGMAAMNVIDRWTLTSECTNGLRFQYSAGVYAGGLGVGFRFCFRRFFPYIRGVENTFRKVVMSGADLILSRSYSQRSKGLDMDMISEPRFVRGWLSQVMTH